MEEVLSKYFSGEATTAEKQKIDKWRSESEENSAMFFEYKEVWLSAQLVPEPDEVVLQSILSMDDHQGFEVLPIWRQSIFKYAASLIIALGVLFLVFKLNNTDGYQLGSVVSELTIYKLPDGSVATLHSGSSLQINDFKEERKVVLTGKAFFEVKRDEEHPFIVNAADAKVQVLGTEFMVNALNSESDIEVLVKSGKVAFGQNEEFYGDKAISIELVKDEMGLIKRDEKGIKKLNILDKNYLSWKTKEITFKDDNLETVVDVLEDVYSVKFQFESATTQNCQLTAHFNNKTIEEIIDIISKTLDIDIKLKGKQATINGTGC